MRLTILEWPVAGIGSMTSQAQAEANGRNPLHSTGPRTEAGIELTRFNSVRHGLRALQTVIPGEAPEEWEAHRLAVVEDLKAAGAVEFALAEQIAVKLWRLGRVVRHEADLIAVGQCEDEILRGHDCAVSSSFSSFSETIKSSAIPNSVDVKKARSASMKRQERLHEWETAYKVLEALEGRKEAEVLAHDEWPIYDALKGDLPLDEKEADSVFKGKEDFAVRHVRYMLKFKGDVADVTEGMLEYWRDEKLPQLRKEAKKAEKVLKQIVLRYKAALGRFRVIRGLLDEAALEKIQRYEAHLERGLHKALDRLQTLQEVRGAIPSSHKPAVAVAVIKAAPEAAEMASFGSSVIETEAGAR
jgi:hypothetical protein